MLKKPALINLTIVLISAVLVSICIKSKHLGPLNSLAVTIVATSMIMLAVCYFFDRKKFKGWLLFVVCIFFFIPILLEILLRVVNPDIVKRQPEPHDFAAIKRLEKLFELKENGVQGTLMPADYLDEFSQRYHVDRPLTGLSNAVAVCCQEDDGLITYLTDENGFRNPSGIYKSNQRLDVFLIGDSFVEGCAVPNGFTIADNLRKLDTHWQVYNGGVGGTGLISFLGVFIEYTLPKQPKNVVVAVLENVSLNRAKRELLHKDLKIYYDNFSVKNLRLMNDSKNLKFQSYLENLFLTQLIKVYQEKVNKEVFGESFFAYVKENSKFVFLIQTLYRIYFDHYDGEGAIGSFDEIPERREILKRVLAYMGKAVDSYGGSFYVVYLPGPTRFYTKNFQEYEYKMVKDLVGDLKINFIDVVSLISSQRNPKRFFGKNEYYPSLGGHYTKEGYQLVSTAIYNRLTGLNERKQVKWEN